MDKVVILCVEDELAVKDAVVRDLEAFASVFRIEAAEDVTEAEEVMEECRQDGDRIGLILCDHVMPGEDGVDFLVRLNKNAALQGVRKVLLTGQAGKEDTIKALNEADLDHYIEKPWTPDNLTAVVKEQLTQYVLAREESLLPYVQILDSARLLEAIAHRRSDR